MAALVPPFTRETATAKVRMAEDGWNSRDPHRVSLVYTEDSQWRNRAEFPVGRKAIVEFLTRKWAKELDYRLIKELWSFDNHRIAVRFAYEWHGVPAPVQPHPSPLRLSRLWQPNRTPCRRLQRAPWPRHPRTSSRTSVRSQRNKRQ